MKISILNDLLVQTRLYNTYRAIHLLHVLIIDVSLMMHVHNALLVTIGPSGLFFCVP